MYSCMHIIDKFNAKVSLCKNISHIAFSIFHEIVNTFLPYKRPCRILPWLIPIIRSRLLISCSAATRASIVNSLSSSSSSIPSLSYTSSSGIASYSLLVPYHIHTNFNIRHTAPNFLQTTLPLLPHQQHRPHSLLHLRMAVNLYLDYWRDLSFLYTQEITSKIVIVRYTRLVLNTMHAIIKAHQSETLGSTRNSYLLVD